MVGHIIDWSLRNRVLVLIASAILLVFGGWTASRMAVDVFPDLTAPTVTVITEAPGMAPQEFESLVTFPIEAALNGASGVRRVRSATAAGIGVVWVEFEWGTDVYAARQVVSEKVQLVAGSLPPEAERPVLAPVSSIMGEIMFLALTSEKGDPMELRVLADYTIRRRLLSLPGVAQVTTIGGDEKQYQVLLEPAKMAAYKVSGREVLAAVREANRNASAGFLISGGQEYLLRGIGRFRDVEDIQSTVVATRNGQPVLLGRVAQVQIGPTLKRGEGSFNGRPAVIIGIQKQPGTNTLVLTEALDRALDEIEKTLPQGVRIERRLFRQAEFISVAVHNVMAALRDGALLVAVILILFLANLPATVITLMAIPLSLVAAALGLQAVGATINTMTLGGMAIAVGALVDDAIIDVENVVRRLRENAARPQESRQPPLKVILSATQEIRSSIVFATVIIVLVFFPLFFLTGVEGRLLKPLGFAYVVALLVSLIVALIVTPALCSFLLPGSKSVLREEESRVVRGLKAAYRPLLESALGHPWPTAFSAGVLTLAAALALAFTGRAFLPEFNEGALTIAAVTLPGTSLPESDGLGRRVEEALLAEPEVLSVGRRTGRAELDEHVQGVEAAELDVSLKMGRRSKEELFKALRRSFSLIPGTNVTIGQPISHRIDHMLSGTKANLAVKIFGEDLYELRRLAEEVRRTMESIPGVADLSVEQQTDVPILRVSYDRRALARFGLNPGEVSDALETAFQGRVVGRILEGRNAFELLVRYKDALKSRPDQLGDILIDTPAGANIPLKLVAEIVRDSGPNLISRENVQRKIVVMCNAAGRDIGSVVRDAREGISAGVKLPEGYFIEYGGQFEAQQEAARRLLVLGVLVVLGIGLLLHMAFGSAADALFIMLNLPLALIGGVAGVFLSGGVLSVASMIGFITLFGIATRNGIMMISHIHHLMEHEGVRDFREAVVRGSLERLSPNQKTALCAGLALTPLALGGGKPGNEIQTPMAVVIVWGLASSTILNMLVVPVLYYRFGKPRTKMPAAQWP
ncbi:MAG: efflux RND transporter permease subunit [Elusimicrobia bacterium]|nr:efflux RND transporter permease subunit [Elusimicrobiota bacterium]